MVPSAHRVTAFGCLLWFLLTLSLGPDRACAETFVAAMDRPSSLTGQWRFQAGDDPRWALADFDDSSWRTLSVPGTWKSAGIPETRIGWYRTTVRLEGEPMGGWAIALGRIFSAFELYADGELIAQAGSFPPNATMEYDRLRVWPLPTSSREVTLALRIYGDPVAPGAGGISRGPLEIGPRDLLLQRFARWDLDRLLLAAIFAFAGLYHLYLYRWRPQLRIYLWFGLCAVAFSGYSVLISQWRFYLSDDYANLKRWEMITAFLLAYMAVRFLWSLLEGRPSKLLELYLAPHLVAVVACLVTSSLRTHVQILDLWLPWAVIGIVWISYRVLRAWYMGHPEGKTVGLGFTVTSISFVHDLLLAKGWITGPTLATYGFAAFVATMAISLAGRFSRVHRELDLLRVDLEQRVHERTLELEHARDAAEQANRAKSRFLAHMSHEIRTPMNGVLGVMDLLANTSLESTQRRYLDLIRSSAEMLLRVINDVLDLSRIEAGHVEIENEPFDLYLLCESLVELAQIDARSKGLELVLVIEPGVPRWVEGDPPRLRQVLGNLINNAVKFTEAGTVKLRLIPMELDSWVRFAVSDTGMGMSEQTLDKLFQPFEQGDSSTQRRFGGTGLGLVIARRLVESAGGLISVKSRLHEGSTFFVDLPLPATEPVIEAPTPAKPTLKPGTRVLLVEDDPINRLVAATKLEDLGLEVIPAEDGESALDRLRDEQVDLVFMDCQLPGMDGYETTRRWRAQEGEGPRLPIVALTAHAVEGERERCLDAGMDDFLTKPLRQDDLLEILQPWAETEPVPATR